MFNDIDVGYKRAYKRVTHGFLTRYHRMLDKQASIASTPEASIGETKWQRKNDCYYQFSYWSGSAV